MQKAASLWQYAHGRIEQLFQVESTSPQLLLDAPKKMNMNFVKDSFADATAHKIVNMKPGDTIVIATGATAQHVGGATIQGLVRKAYTDSLDENALASEIMETSRQQAYLVTGSTSTATCMVAYLTESQQ